MSLIELSSCEGVGWEGLGGVEDNEGNLEIGENRQTEEKEKRENDPSLKWVCLGCVLMGKTKQVAYL